MHHRFTLAAQICDGMEHMHRKGYVHYDLKVRGTQHLCLHSCVHSGTLQLRCCAPLIQNDNILITFHGQQPHACVADFGLARQLGPDGVCSYRETANMRQVPEINAALEADPCHPYTRVITQFYDVWALGKRVLPRLLPPDLCAAADRTWHVVQDGLIAACLHEAPMGRPRMMWLSILFASLARGDSAVNAAAKAQYLYRCPSCDAVAETCDCDGP